MRLTKPAVSPNDLVEEEGSLVFAAEMNWLVQLCGIHLEDVSASIFNVFGRDCTMILGK